MKKILYILTVALVFTACSSESTEQTNQNEFKTYKWRLVTAWPKNYPGLGMAPERIAKLVEEMSQGQMQITVFGAGEQVQAFGVFDAVSTGQRAQCEREGNARRQRTAELEVSTGLFLQHGKIDDVTCSRWWG